MPDMIRLFVEPGTIGPESATVGPEGKHYLISVLRLKPGDELELFDGTGKCYKAQIEEIYRQGVSFKIISGYTKPVEARIKLTLGQGLIKSDKMDWVVQKATELGVSRIVPIITQRSHQISMSHWPGKQSRWQKIALEAVRQSGRTAIPTIAPPIPLTTFLNQTETIQKLIFLENLDRPTKNWSIYLANESEIALLIGPEGGFEAQESADAIASGCQPVNLGPRILRAETAALAALSIVQYALGELG